MLCIVVWTLFQHFATFFWHCFNVLRHCFDVVSTLGSDLYQRFPTLKIQCPILFHFQCRMFQIADVIMITSLVGLIVFLTICYKSVSFHIYQNVFFFYIETIHRLLKRIMFCLMHQNERRGASKKSLFFPYLR